MKKLVTKIGTRGDTIIEILLAIAVLSLVLSVSYGLSNRSAQAVRQAQERGEAQKIAEEQLEFMRGYFSPDQPWEDRCFNEDGNPSSDDGECHRGPGGRYNIVDIEQSGNTFTVHLNWPNVTGGTDELSLAYKLPVTGDIPITPHTECSDDIDNGPILDGVKDDNDPNCWLVPGNPATYDPTLDPEDPPPQCIDSADNDGDSLVDFGEDPGCSGPADNNEFNPPPPQCNDGLDNDGDSLVDFGEDPGCTSFGDNNEFNVPPPQCNDGLDNDGDFLRDTQDPGCHSDGDRYSPYSYQPTFNDESRCNFGYKTLCF